MGATSDVCGGGSDGSTGAFAAGTAIGGGLSGGAELPLGLPMPCSFLFKVSMKLGTPDFLKNFFSQSFVLPYQDKPLPHHAVNRVDVFDMKGSRFSLFI